MQSDSLAFIDFEDYGSKVVKSIFDLFSSTRFLDRLSKFVPNKSYPLGESRTIEVHESPEGRYFYVMENDVDGKLGEWFMFTPEKKLFHVRNAVFFSSEFRDDYQFYPYQVGYSKHDGLRTKVIKQFIEAGEELLNFFDYGFKKKYKIQ